MYQVICEKSSFNKKHSIAKTVASVRSKQIIILAGSALRVALLCVESPGFSLFKSSMAVQPLCRHNEAWGALSGGVLPETALHCSQATYVVTDV